MGDIGSVVKTLTGGPGISDLAQHGYSQYGGGTAPSLNMGAYGGYAPTQIHAAQAGQNNIDQGQADQFLGGQHQLVSQLQAQAMGQGPNPAQQQFQQNTQQNIAQQAALGAARGNQNPGLQSAMTANQGAAINQGAAGQAAINQSHQQLEAQGQLGQALGSYGGQQIGLAENQAGLNQNTMLANMQAQNAIAQTNQNAANAATQFGLTSAQQGNNAQQAQYQFGQNLSAQSQNQLNQILGGFATNAANNASSFVGGAANGAAGALANVRFGGGGGGGGIGASDGGAATTGAGDQGGAGGSGDFSGNYDASLGSATGALITRPTERILGEGHKPEVVVPLTRGNPHAFLDRMIEKNKQGGGTTPGRPVPPKDLVEALSSKGAPSHEDTAGHLKGMLAALSEIADALKGLKGKN